MNFVKSRLLDSEFKSKGSNTDTTGTNFGFGASNSEFRREKCFGYHQWGHIKRNCPKFSNRNEKANSNSQKRNFVGSLRGTFCGRGYEHCSSRNAYCTSGEDEQEKHRGNETRHSIFSQRRLAWIVAKCVLRYLSQTNSLNLTYNRKSSDSGIIAYSDADYATDVMNRKSDSGSACFYKGSLVFWQSKKQDCVAKSIYESKYLAASLIASEVVNLVGIAC
ncbi:hypothetical protein JTB14_029946 [Gonioctena quinquepunctata]|nr:hypothetical protein JTB14_029946 [Gonioctena quinquepunctata]